MNCLVAAAPSGSGPEVARALLAADPGAAVTLMSDDTEGLLAVLDQPGLGRCEILWADAGAPSTVEDALVHRRMLHGSPDVLVVAVDGVADASWALGCLLVRRADGAPLLLTGTGAEALVPDLTALAAAVAEESGYEPAWSVVPGSDPAAVLRQAESLVRAAVARPGPEGPLLHGHCTH